MEGLLLLIVIALVIFAAYIVIAVTWIILLFCGVPEWMAVCFIGVGGFGVSKSKK